MTKIDLREACFVWVIILALPLAGHYAGDGDTTGGSSQLKRLGHVKDLSVSILSDPRRACLSNR
jgi:hypothetical protein